MRFEYFHKSFKFQLIKINILHKQEYPMTNRYLIFFITLFLVITCGNNQNEIQQKRLNGKWERDTKVVILKYTFFEDGTYVYTLKQYDHTSIYRGKYKLKGDKLITEVIDVTSNIEDSKQKEEFKQKYIGKVEIQQYELLADRLSLTFKNDEGEEHTIELFKVD